MAKPTRWQKEEVVTNIRIARESVRVYVKDDWTLNQLMDMLLRLAQTIEVQDDDES